MKYYVIMDFETASAADLKVCGAWRYAEDPTTEIICAGFARQRQPVVVHDAKALMEKTCELRTLAADPDAIFIAHSAQFEKAIWRNLMVPVFGYCDIPDARWHDTQASCAMRAIPIDLEMASRVLQLPVQKDKEGRAAVLKLSRFSLHGGKRDYRNRDPQLLQRVYEYNRQDVLGQRALHERVGSLTAEERKVWLLDQTINQRGVCLDLPLIRRMQEIIELAVPPLVSEFALITGGLVPGQVAQHIAWIAAQGVAIPNLQKATVAAIIGANEGQEEDASLAGDLLDAAWPTYPPQVIRTLEIRQLATSASIKKLPKMEACLCQDGRARGLLQYHGAAPGRWAGRLLQPQNFPRGEIKLDGKAPPPNLTVEALMTGDPAYVAALIGPPLPVVIGALRHTLVPAASSVINAGDFAGIEARIVLALAGQHDKTAIMAAGKDVYCDMATQIFGRPITKEHDPEERTAGKNSVLGLGFQMGARKFRFSYARNHPLSFAERVVETYRKEWAPCVPRVWYALEEAAVRTVWDRTPHEAYGIRYALEDRWLTARLPSGRKLWYFNPEPVRKAMPWDDTDIRPGFTYQSMKMGMFRTINAFGGLLTENAVQALARDLMVDAMFKAEAAGLPIVLTVHDEIVTETAQPQAEALRQIMTDSPAWAKGIGVPVAAETWSGDRYKK